MKKIITLFAGGVLLATSVNAQTVTNAGLETWRNYSVGGNAYESPTDWYTLDSAVAVFAPTLLMTPGKKHVFQSTSMHSGSFAAMIMTRDYTLTKIPGGMANAAISINIAAASYAMKGGTAVTQRMGTASAWVKYVPKSTSDTASILVQAVLANMGAGGTDSVIGTGMAKITGSGTYRQVSAGITYINSTVVPTHIQVAFLSSGLLSPTATDSSALYIDDVTIANNVGVSQTIFKAAVVQVYPNPASGNLYLASNEAGKLTWEAVAANGQLVASKEFTQTATVSLNNIPAGVYFFRVLNDRKELVQTGKFIVK